jgi:polysaccharide chain length determinant protein (PEP-CTERM system associated)
MLGHRELTIGEYAQILKHRFWLILLCTILLLGAGIALTYALPPRYESQTLILVEQQRVPEDYVKPVIDEGLDARLASMKEQILSRSRLEPIITKYNLFAGKSRNMDDRVDLTRKAIVITPIHSEVRSSGGLPGFFIAFDASDALTAQEVCGEITSLFVSENLSAREQSAEGTTDFLKQQLDDAKRSLDDEDARLAAFQQKYFGRLPDQETSNANTLQALTTQLDASTQSINHLQQNVTFLETMVSQQMHDAQLGLAPGQIPVDERQKELKDLLAQKAEMDAQLTPDHPDEIEISRKIADLRSDIARTPFKAQTVVTAAHPPDSPQLQQLKAQLTAAQQSVAAAKKAQAQIELQIRKYEARIESSPAVEAEYKKLTRDHESALQFYNSLLTKMNESSMATALERRQQGEQFRVMDSPNLPDAPKFPNRLVFAAGGGVGGLFLGLLLSGLLEYRDTALRNERDIWAFTKLSTLATISHLDELARIDKQHRGRKSKKSLSITPVETVGG